MIEVLVSMWTEPVKMQYTTTHGTEVAKVPISRLRNKGNGDQAVYEGLVVEPEKNAPWNPCHSSKGEVWVHVVKAYNKGLKLPVLEIGKEVVL